MTISRETLMAFVDGELSAAEAQRIEAEIANDRELASYVAEQKRVKARLHADFAPLLLQPIPQTIERAVLNASAGAQSDSSTSPGWLRKIQEGLGFGTQRSLWPAGALAAGIVLGFMVAGPFGSGANIASRDGALVAQGELARTLSNVLAQDEPAGQPTHIGVSFVSRDKHLCRSFTSAGDKGAMAGIACREGDQWRIATLAAAAPSASQGGFQTAAAAMPVTLRAALSEMIAGDPLDADAERAAKSRGWQTP